jgi:hypothetical protein
MALYITTWGLQPGGGSRPVVQTQLPDPAKMLVVTGRDTGLLPIPW